MKKFLIYTLRKLLRAEVQHVTCSDYTGKSWKKIEFIYTE